MVRLQILAGGKSGTSHVIQRFPCLIGRSAGAGLRLEDAGVWDQHLRLELDPEHGFVLTLQPNALATHNGERFESARLRNGDVIQLGDVKLQFWLRETDQELLTWREALTWTGIAALTLAQIGLITWLVR
ncbi:MAG: FHA domain-containing protein [Verrucomicrobiota bacterium]